MIYQLEDHPFAFYKYIVIFTRFGRWKFRYAVLSYYFCATTPISMEQQNQADLVQEIEKDESYVDPVPRGIRFVNYVVDQLVMGAIINAGMYVFKYVVSSKGENYKSYLIFQENMSGLMAGFLLALAVLFSYYLIFEAVTKGRTFGKILTGTVAITQEGSPFTFKHALLRTLCRLIPFESFSAFGYMPWHDSMTKTCVVKKTW